jgi:sporulation protein YlmC with PRC-barrel domain
MKIRSGNITPWLAAVLCLTLVPATKAADDASKSMAPASQQTSADPQSSEGTPTRADKASNILGMKVRNESNQYLGRIKDLVIDWKNEQVAYAVLRTGGSPPFGQGAKLLAVPLTALTTSQDQKYLILNADKSKLETAMGFDSDHWPSVSNPSWGAEPFWQK